MPKNLAYKLILNALLITIVVTFHSDIAHLLGDYIYFVGAPIAFSFVYLLWNLNANHLFSFKRFITFLIAFCIIYVIFNLNEPNFKSVYLIMSIPITVIYDVFLEMVFPSDNRKVN